MASVSESDIEYTSSGLLDLLPEISMKCDNSNISRSTTCLARVSSTPVSNNNMNPKLNIYPPNTPISISSIIDSEWKISRESKSNS